MNRLEILEQSLVKKQEKYDRMVNKAIQTGLQTQSKGENSHDNLIK